jgi:hypothetical protein
MVLVVFVVFLVVLRYFLVAIIVAVQREQHLRNEYQSHPLWPHSKHAIELFNPAKPETYNMANSNQSKAKAGHKDKDH